MANEQEKTAQRKSADDSRKVAAKQAQDSTAAARKASMETLKEQQQMKPVPSQEDADLARVGATPPDGFKETDQPDGPAAAAAEETVTRNAEAQGSAGYQTRAAKPKNG